MTMIYVTVTTGADIDFDFREFWVDEQHLPNLLAALGLLSNTLSVTQAMEMTK